jgi:glycosyltransferase involved in cell wall biosynthesis
MSDLEVVVVNNNSTDDTRKVAESFRSRFVNFLLLEENRQGLSYARNHGWQESHGEYVAFLDDDAAASHDWCERIVEAFRSVHPKPASVGGMILPLYETTPPRWFTDDFEVRSWGDAAAFLEGLWGQFGFSGSNMAFPRELMERYGGFRADLGMKGNKLWLGEEKEFFFRLYQDHPRFWYDPQIQVRHWVPNGHMQISYLLWRSFRAGQSRSLIQPCKLFSTGYFDEMKGLAGTLKELLTDNFPLKDDFRTSIIRKMCRVIHQLGFLLGPGRSTPKDCA